MELVLGEFSARNDECERHIVIWDKWGMLIISDRISREQ